VSLVTFGSAQLLSVPLKQLEQLAGRHGRKATRRTHLEERFVHPTLCDPTVNQTAGYIPVTSDVEYFFWLFESKSDPVSDPLIMWLSGGPGCSSQLALFAENGPCVVAPGGSTTLPNEYSWHNKASVLWVDQPAGVGFSTGLGTHNEAGVASNMLVFLHTFYERFTMYKKTDFYIFGESYGGHYVPSIAHRIWQSNNAGEEPQIPMKGIAIGNGMTHPEEQYKWYPEMAATGGQQRGGHAPAGVVPAKQAKVMQFAMPMCLAAIRACNKGVTDPTNESSVIDTDSCIAAYDFCNLVTQIPYQLTGLNPYDMRVPCGDGNLCYDFDMIGTFLNSPEVQIELGVNLPWESCNMQVNLDFVMAGDWMLNCQMLIPDLLRDGIEVLIYAGDQDYICNWLGNKAWTIALEWEGHSEFENAEDLDWRFEGETVAKLRSARGFHFMQVFDAGHMVPKDKPEASLEMVNTFISRRLTRNTESTRVAV